MKWFLGGRCTSMFSSADNIFKVLSTVETSSCAVSSFVPFMFKALEMACCYLWSSWLLHRPRVKGNHIPTDKKVVYLPSSDPICLHSTLHHIWCRCCERLTIGLYWCIHEDNKQCSAGIHRRSSREQRLFDPSSQSKKDYITAKFFKKRLWTYPIPPFFYFSRLPSTIENAHRRREKSKKKKGGNMSLLEKLRVLTLNL